MELRLDGAAASLLPPRARNPSPHGNRPTAAGCLPPSHLIRLGEVVCRTDKFFYLHGNMAYVVLLLLLIFRPSAANAMEGCSPSRQRGQGEAALGSNALARMPPSSPPVASIAPMFVSIWLGYCVFLTRTAAPQTIVSSCPAPLALH